MVVPHAPAATQEEIIAQVRDALRDSPAQAAYLFGSWARGTADHYSDIDLVIIYETNRPFFDRFHDFDAVYRLPLALDLLIYRPDEFASMIQEGNPFIEQVLKTGVKLL